MYPTPHPRDIKRPTPDQLAWIAHRDRIGAVLDDYLATKPPPLMREAIEVMEDSLRLADRLSGLT